MLLQSRSQQPKVQYSPAYTRIFNVLAVMELPAFVIGRTTTYQGLWARYQSSRTPSAVNEAGEYSEIEDISGLPMSLIDLFVYDPADLPERELWDWPGIPGTTLCLQLWETYRLAGILDRRIRCSWARAPISAVESPPTHTPTDLGDEGAIKATTHVLALRCISSLHAIYIGAVKSSKDDDMGVTTCVTYPLFVVSLHILWSLQRSKDNQFGPLSDDATQQYNSAWQNILEPWWEYLENMYRSENVKIQKALVQEVVKQNSIAPSISIDDVARSHDWELTLL